MADLDAWMAALDQGRTLEWRDDPEQAAKPEAFRTVVVARRVGGWYWVGRCYRVGEGAVSVRAHRLGERDAVREALAQVEGAGPPHLGEPDPVCLVDPLLGTTHGYEFFSSDGHIAHTLQVYRRPDGEFVRGDGLQIFDGMGFGDMKHTGVDASEALAAVEEAMRGHQLPRIFKAV